MDKQQTELEKMIASMEKKALKALSSNYKLFVKWLLGEMFELFAKGEALTYVDVVRYNRLANFKRMVMAYVGDLSARNQTIIVNLLKESGELSYDYMSYAIESTASVLLSNSVQRLEAAVIARQNPINGLTLEQRLQKQRADVVQRINTSIEQGLIQNKTMKEIAADMREQVQIDERKSVRIARTETHRVTQKAQYDAVMNGVAQGIQMMKTWRSSRDERVRRKVMANHRFMDGQKVAAEEFFIGKSGRGPHPGALGSAAEDVNCRCRVSYTVEAIRATTTNERLNQSFSAWRNKLRVGE